ncbi:MAG: YceD family protein [Candidatus Limnocylindria bacterium]
MIINVAPLLKQPVGTRIGYPVREDPIEPRGANAGLLEAGATSIDADITATHTNPGAYLEGEARASIGQQCSRCLRTVSTPVVVRFAEQYYATIAVISGEDVAEAPIDAKTIGSDFRIDLTPLLREELILATPQAPLCRPDCKGLCPTCGADLDERPHEHDEAVDERWAALQRLRDFHADRE